jgi:glyoxylase-like metal-dependent hydrolase (beta-lactamase superfamily II)
MKCKKSIFAICAVFLSVGIFAAAKASQNSSSPLDIIKSRIKVVSLSDNVIVLTGNLLPGGGYVIAINSDRGIAVVDTGGSPGIAALMREIIEGEFGGEKFTHVIHTHGHGDHTNGNQAFSEAVVVAHENSVKSFRRYSEPHLLEQMASSCIKQAENFRKRLKSLDPDSEDYEITELRAAINEQIAIDIEQGLHVQLPEITFSGRMSLDMGNLTLKMYYLKNYHSDNDILIHIPEEGILLLGDTLSRSVLPGTNSFLSSVDIPRWLNALDQILQDGAGVEHAVRGHSYIMTGEEIVARRDYIKQVWDAVTQANSEGLTPDEIIPKLPMEDFGYLIQQYQRKPEELKNYHERIITGFWRQLQNKAFATEILLESQIESGLEAAIEKYKSLASQKEKYYFDESIVNAFAQGLLRSGETLKAQGLLKVHVSVFPDSAQAHSLLGDVLMTDGKIEEAIDAYEKAHSLAPSDNVIKGKLEKAKASKK